MSTEKTVAITVEAVGTVTWPNPDDRWNAPETIARVVDADGFRYLITSRLCFRNGTVITPDIVGKPGTIGVYQCSPVWFNLPTLFRR